MHIEVQVALNFVISYLYNKLPRRRVNIFGEELEKALKEKFDGHWYPEKPFKGSAFRCLKTGDPVDGVFVKAAKESGVPITDVLEHLPSELAVWVDPGEVSYRIGEKGAVKVLYSEGGEGRRHPASSSSSCSDGDEVAVPTSVVAAACVVPPTASPQQPTPFNPEAQCFRPVESRPPSPCQQEAPGFKPPPPSPPPPFHIHRPHHQITFTTATFAQTKFGSTKLKTNAKRPNRYPQPMSPTEFSNYIKQRAAIQQQQQQQQQHGVGLHSPVGGGNRSGSPDYGGHLFGVFGGSGRLAGSGASAGGGAGAAATAGGDGSGGLLQPQAWPPQGPTEKQLIESLANFTLGPGQFQHLLVAN